jgi:hypothetical protein
VVLASNGNREANVLDNKLRHPPDTDCHRLLATRNLSISSQRKDKKGEKKCRSLAVVSGLRIEKKS